MSLPRYPEYKDSGVAWLGEVPGHWKVKRFKQVLKERDERSDDGLETLLSVSAYTGVSPRSELIEEGEHLSRADSLEGYKICYPNDLVMNIMLAWNRGLAFSDYEGIVSPAYSVFQVIDSSFPKFLNYLVRTDLYTLYFKAFSSGVIDSRLRLYPDVFGRLSCVLPSLEEQQAIAAFLDRETGKIDTLIAEQRRLVELLTEKRQAVISHAVTKGLNPNARMKYSGIEWLGEVPEHWDVLPLKQVISQIESGVSVNASDSPASDTELGVLKTSCVYSGQFDANENKTVIESEIDRVSCSLKAGTLIVSRMNTPELVGAAGLVKVAPENIYLPDRLWQVSFSSALPAFVHYWTQSVFYRAQIRVVCAGTSSSMQNLGQDQFRSFDFPNPPLAEQQSIAEFLDTETAKFDTLTAEANRAIELLQERRSALISAAVTGKIDVRKAA